MANAEYLSILYQGASVWNEWRNTESVQQPDLSGALLRDADLSWANLRGANLRQADLSSAEITEADLAEADLSEANLRGANLRSSNLDWAVLRGADLRGADLGGANLSEADLTGADLVRADLSEANLNGTKLTAANLFGADLTGANLMDAEVADTEFGDVDLSAVQGLTAVRHAGPSSIGIDTLYRSRGEIPDVFLRGAGVPEPFISMVGSLVGKQVRPYSCMISHSPKDARFCDRLYADLQTRGVRTWYLPKHVRRGKEFLQAIELNTRMFDRVIFVCSRHSLNAPLVLREMERALRREKNEHRPVLYPVQVDSYVLEHWTHPWQTLVSQRLVADFRGWQRSAKRYQQGLNQLIIALNARG